jgi:DUF4097 and DUF4098 domain-containing protein YvlB
MLSRDQPITYDLNLDSVNGHIAVAGIHTGKVDIDTVNGRIEIEKMHGDVLEANTQNGRIKLKDCEMETGEISTDNGRLELINVNGNTMKGTTDNGSIRGEMSFEHARLETDMGSIVIDVDRSVPYHIDAATGMGKVRVASDLEVASQNKHSVTIESSAFEGAEEGLSVTTRTDMGSIRIR